MKNLLVIATLVFASVAYTQSKQIVIDGKQNQFNAEIVSAVYRTEYRTEYRETTCSREVFDGYRERCYWEPGETTCHDVGGGQICGITPEHGRVCHDQPSRRECSTSSGRDICSHEATYRTEYYSCTESVSVPYQVRVYDVRNQITIDLEKSSQLDKNLQEVLSLNQSGESFSLSALKTTGRVLISATQTSAEVSNNGLLKTIRTQVKLKLINRQNAVGPFIGGISELTGDINTLEITTGLITDLSVLKIEIEARRNRLLGGDPVVIQKVLTLDDMQLINQGDRTLIRIDFNKLGGPAQLQGKKAKIDLRIGTSISLENIVNRSDMPSETFVSKRLKASF